MKLAGIMFCASLAASSAIGQSSAGNGLFTQPVPLK